MCSSSPAPNAPEKAPVGPDPPLPPFHHHRHQRRFAHRCHLTAVVPGKRTPLDIQAALTLNVDGAAGSQSATASTGAISPLNMEIPDVDVQER